MMLDITGSMDGSKIRDLKDAAKDLIDIVLIQETRKSRIALVPFSEPINIEPLGSGGRIQRAAAS